jgi:hypothetical protein
MQNTEITKSRAEELLRFLPNFSLPKRKYIKEWKGGKSPDGALTFPHPMYEEDVAEFFHLASQECWSDYDYDPKAAGRMLEDDRALDSADINTIKTLLTYCVRGERFCDGHWGAVLEAGRVQKLLVRLQQLVPTLPC